MMLFDGFLQWLWVTDVVITAITSDYDAIYMLCGCSHLMTANLHMMCVVVRSAQKWSIFAQKRDTQQRKLYNKPKPKTEKKKQVWLKPRANLITRFFVVLHYRPNGQQMAIIYNATIVLWTRFFFSVLP